MGTGGVGALRLLLEGGSFDFALLACVGVGGRPSACVGERRTGPSETAAAAGLAAASAVLPAASLTGTMREASLADAAVVAAESL